jgi:hypothetical protein
MNHAPDARPVARAESVAPADPSGGGHYIRDAEKPMPGEWLHGRILRAARRTWLWRVSTFAVCVLGVRAAWFYLPRPWHHS